MNWEEELLNTLTKLQLDYYDHGSKGDTVAPNIDARVVIEAVKSLLKQQRENCAKEWDSLGYTELNDNPPRVIFNVIKNAPEPKELK